MRIISLALRQRIFGSIRRRDNCNLWCGNPKDALIFRGKKRQVREIAFYLFVPTWKESDSDRIYACASDERCISPNHLDVSLGGPTDRITFHWERLKIGLCDQVDIVTLYRAGVSKRTLKQWYMLETNELDYILRTLKDWGKSK